MYVCIIYSEYLPNTHEALSSISALKKSDLFVLCFALLLLLKAGWSELTR